YLMKNFAVQSGKSKGQFYTPAEVSRIMSKVIGIAKATKAAQSVYDPACGSGSLLIKAASEAGTKLSVFGQEIDNSMAGLAKMNMILHDIPTAEIHRNNTLSTPGFKNQDGSLQAFDFAVANPPFSVKNWKDGFDPEHDLFNRFDGFGIPPDKNGDYAFLLHLIKSLKSTGKGAIILPHGVLFRGGAEAEIRKNLVKRKYIKGIIGLPANLFYGTGIPACIIVIDKEQDPKRDYIFFIDASKGYVKDGNKNRLREQDIHKIVDVFSKFTEMDKYSRRVRYEEIEKNEYNLNIPRYIDTSAPEDLQDIEGHLKGGIPMRDIDALDRYWMVMPELRNKLFASFGREGYLKLNIASGDLNRSILDDKQFNTFKERWMNRLSTWAAESATSLKQVMIGDKPKAIIHEISEELLTIFKPNPLLDGYEIYQILMQYWADTMQDDIYQIVVEGWKADKELIPPELIIKKYFQSDQKAIDELQEQKEAVTGQMTELEEEQTEDSDFFEDARTEKGKLSKASINARIKTIKHDKDARDELKTLRVYLTLLEEEAEIKAKLRRAIQELETKVGKKYQSLSEDEIKTLLVEDKWLAAVIKEVQATLEIVSHRLSSRIKELAERYAQPLPEIETEVSDLTAKVEEHLKRMGFTWK
ncbi:MAG: type restriction enzyme protein, partial [Candidatus Cloacimonadota bacterium]|nr:type restriction enzyme protein [Candidatus Cloacimonadota bacterium]